MNRASAQDEEEDRVRTAQLRASEERLRAIFNSEPECIKVVDLSGCILDMNAAGLAMIEADSLADVVGRAVSSFVHPEDLAGVQALFAQALAGTRGACTFRIRTLRGSERWAESHATPLRAASGSVTAVLTVTHDVTERRRAREERDLYSQAMRAMNVGLFILELPEGGSPRSFRFAAANEAALRLTRQTEEEVIGATVDERLPALFRTGVIERALDALRTRTASLIGDVAYADERIPNSVFNVALAPISSHSLAMTFQDVTEQRRLQDELRHATHMEAVGRLAGGVAHDFNNLLAIILGYLQSALATEDLPAPIRADLDQANLAAERAARITGQLLAFSRRQVLRPRVVDVDALLHDLQPLLARMLRADISFDLQTNAGHGCVRVDPGQLEQVFVNLVANACDAMPGVGMLAVRTMRIDGGPGQPPMLRVSVADTGAGMDEQTRDRIFEPFFTTKADRASGLGLSTVLGIVEQSGGTIRCESRVGHGSRFDMDLPLVDAAADPAPPMRRPLAAGRESVLVVEDQAALRRLMAVSLERAGYRVETAATGEEAVAMARAGRSFDAIVTDLSMPGLDGRQVAGAIGALSPGTRIIFVSGYFDDPRAAESHAHFLQKPFRPAALADKVREALESR